MEVEIDGLSDFCISRTIPDAKSVLAASSSSSSAAASSSATAAASAASPPHPSASIKRPNTADDNTSAQKKQKTPGAIRNLPPIKQHHVPVTDADREKLAQFECAICMDTVFDPIVLPCRGDHIYCFVCIEKAFISGTTECPQCRDVISPADRKDIISMKSNRFLFEYDPRTAFTFKKFMAPIQVKCRRHESGCDWKGSLDAEFRHDGVCPWTPDPCPHCKGNWVRREQLTHPCPTRPVPCDCKQLIPPAEMETHKSTVCPERAISCTELECLWKGLQKDQPDHVSKCMEAHVSCYRTGCTALVRRKDLAKHAVDNETVHSLLATIAKQARIMNEAIDCSRCRDGSLYLHAEAGVTCNVCQELATHTCTCEFPNISCRSHKHYH